MTKLVVLALAMFSGSSVFALSLAPCSGSAVEIQICQIKNDMLLKEQAWQSKLNALDARLCVAQNRAAYSNYRDFECQPMWVAGVAPAGIAPTNNVCLPVAARGKAVNAHGGTYTCNKGAWVFKAAAASASSASARP